MIENNGQEQGKVQRLVIEYDRATHGMRHYMEGDRIPPPMLVNYLEVLKSSLVNEQLSYAKAHAVQRAQTQIVGPDGTILR